MPPKKVPPPASATTGDEGTPSKQDAMFREGINIEVFQQAKFEDLNLPKSIVTRLAKGVLPPNTQIQGNAMLAMTKSATVFVNYLASHANEYASSANRKSIMPADVFAALDEAQLSDFRPRLEAELAKFNEVQADKRNAYKSKVASNKAAGISGTGEDGNEEGDSMVDREGQPAAKKARLDPDESLGMDGAMDPSEMNESYSRADHTADEDGEDGADETEEDEDEGDGEERLEVEERLEDLEEREEQDEALDNGEDSE